MAEVKGDVWMQRWWPAAAGGGRGGGRRRSGSGSSGVYRGDIRVKFVSIGIENRTIVQHVLPKFRRTRLHVFCSQNDSAPAQHLAVSQQEIPNLVMRKGTNPPSS